MINEINSNKILKRYLKDNDRIKHCISTADFMKKYAQKFNINKDYAYIAGLLHDLTKDMSNNKILKLSKSFIKRRIINIKYLNYKKKHPVLLHGVAAAEIMIRKFKINNIELLESACYHTCGGSNLTDLSIFTFISDFCEPLRNYIPSKKVYKIIVKENNLYKAYLYTYIYLIRRLMKKQKIIVPESIDGYNDALRLYKK